MLDKLTQKSYRPLTRDFFDRDAVWVAKALLGHWLIYQPADNAQTLVAFQIVETEAYRQDDPACHAYGKTTGRAANLYESPGTAYVYLIYGMYYCLNVVCEPKGVGAAVLFRALEPFGETIPPFKTHGPGRLCKALGINKAHNGIDLTDAKSPLYLAQNPKAKALCSNSIITTTRVGISQAQGHLWRFYLRQSPYVSSRDKKAELALSERALQKKK
ncbi:MAG: DNA-3-methyladenine glycosylase [Vampirovibrionales bacterium]|nr:DNA-3-methyladenine glycosylase [Vampirovibrionales bacterium]